MDREQFKLGLAALKAEIKRLSDKQKTDKTIIRMPRKTGDDRKAVEIAMLAAGYSAKYYPPYPGNAQSNIWQRKPVITAYLSVYARVRGKIHCQTPVDAKWEKEAQDEFDNATKAVVVA